MRLKGLSPIIIEAVTTPEGDFITITNSPSYKPVWIPISMVEVVIEALKASLPTIKRDKEAEGA